MLQLASRTPAPSGKLMKDMCPNCSDHHVQIESLMKHGWVSDLELDLVGDHYASLKKRNDPSVLKKKFSCFFSKYLFTKHFVRQ